MLPEMPSKLLMKWLVKMAKRIAEFKSKERITFVTISKDWYTLTPWKFRGENVNYFDVRRELKETVQFTYVYLGTIRIISGKWVEYTNRKTND